MAEMIRKFFEVNDMDVLVVAILYFTSVIGGWIYCCKKWKRKENEDKLYKTQNDTYGCGTIKAAKDVADRKGSADHSTRRKIKYKGWCKK